MLTGSWTGLRRMRRVARYLERRFLGWYGASSTRLCLCFNVVKYSRSGRLGGFIVGKCACVARLGAFYRPLLKARSICNRGCLHEPAGAPVKNLYCPYSKLEESLVSSLSWKMRSQISWAPTRYIFDGTGKELSSCYWSRLQDPVWVASLCVYEYSIASKDWGNLVAQY